MPRYQGWGLHPIQTEEEMAASESCWGVVTGRCTGNL